MKIFHCVESYHPALGGMQEVVKQLSERLAALGHDVTVLTRYHPERVYDELNGVKIESYRIDGNPKEATTEEERRYVSRLLSITGGVITFFAAQQWATDLALPHLREIRARKVSVPTGYSGLYWPEFRSYFEKMRTYIHGYDMNVYLSDNYRDINFARENGVKHTMIIPNGAAADEFTGPVSTDVRAALGIPADHFLLLHVGSYTGWKGHLEAMEIFLNADIGNATMLMIGNNSESFSLPWKERPWLSWRIRRAFRKSARRRIIFGYYKRAFTVDAYRQADLFLFPSNVECSPIVLFECAASRLPFLSTDVGNAREIAKWTGGGMIMPTTIGSDGFSHANVEASAEMLTSLYRNAAQRKNMSEHAFDTWQKQFTWEAIARRYEALYLELTGS